MTATDVPITPTKTMARITLAKTMVRLTPMLAVGLMWRGTTPPGMASTVGPVASTGAATVAIPGMSRCSGVASGCPWH